MLKLDRLLAQIAPFDCLVCRRESDVICQACLINLPTTPGSCYRCRQDNTQLLCDACQSCSPLTSVWAATNYSGAAARLLFSLKYERVQAAARCAAWLMHLRLPRLPSETVVSHLPTANIRVRQRGYDQSQLIARYFAQFRQLPYHATVFRIGKTRQQGANRLRRLQQLQQAYICKNTNVIIGANLLLIDDVITTGSSVETAATQLLMAGANQVAAACFAQRA